MIGYCSGPGWLIIAWSGLVDYCCGPDWLNIAVVWIGWLLPWSGLVGYCRGSDWLVIVLGAFQVTAGAGHHGHQQRPWRRQLRVGLARGLLSRRERVRAGRGDALAADPVAPRPSTR